MLHQPVRIDRQAPALFRLKRSINLFGPRNMRRKLVDQRRSPGKPAQPGNRRQPFPLRQHVRLAVIDHLHAVFDRPIESICLAQRGGIGGIDHPMCSKRRQRVARRGSTQGLGTSAMDQLMDLGEKLDLANTAAPALQVIARRQGLPLGMVIADSCRNRANLSDRAEIKRTPPDKGLHRRQKPPTKREITRRCPRADKGCSLPRQRG